MTWTYSGNPATNLKDNVRWLITDTIESRPLIQDEEVAFALTQNGDDPKKAAASIIDVLLLRIGMTGKVRLGRWEIDLRDTVDALKAAKEELDATIPKGIAWAGGLSHDEKKTDWADTDLVKPRFYRDIHSSCDPFVSED